jgi:predicted TIM-barrel fold metal-dependent hydrolase
VLHFDAADLLEFRDLLRKLPVPFIIDHMGRVPVKDGIQQEPFKQLIETLKRDNCWVKICGAERISAMGPPFTDALPYGRMLIKTAPDRILWGTDWPHPNIKQHMPNDGDLVDLIPRFAPDPAIQHKILVENPKRLYGFE